jgi:hypothetical protein
MPAAWQASGTLLGSTGADITPVIPTHVAGDLMILLASSRVVTETLTTPSGWTVIGGPTDVTAWRTYALYKWADSAAETNPLLDWSAAVGEKYGQVHTIRNARRGALSGYVLNADLTDPITHAGVTSEQRNQMIAVIGIGSDNASASVTSVTATDPASFTQRHFSTIVTGADASGWFFDATRVEVGATGTITQDFVSTMPAAAALVLPVPEAVVPQVTMSRAIV